MTDDLFEQSETNRQAKQRGQNHSDFNNELAGANTGRMVRFGVAQSREIEAQEKGNRKKSALLIGKKIKTSLRLGWLCFQKEMMSLGMYLMSFR